MPLSGPDWVSQFPTSKSADDLAEPFRSRAKKFLAALQAAGAKIEIGDTLRSPERAYLMHYAFRIARKGMDPATVPAMAGVDIEWTHPESAESVDAAEAMLASYEIVHEPALDTRHTEGLAIDMTIAWLGELRIARADGSITTVASLPRDGGGNLDLRSVGASYGVFKLASDPPHWSSDGH